LTRRLFAIGAGLALCLVPVLGVDLPRKAPELAIPLPTGQQVLLSQFRGKVVVIEFIHTTCPHCQHSSAIVERLYKDLGPRGFQPLAVAFNENAALLVPDFARQVGATFPIGIGNRDEVLSYLQYSLVKPLYVPQMVIVDRKGMIRAQYSGEDDFFKDLEPNLRAQLEALLKEPAGTQRRAPSKTLPGRKTATTAQR
jgi:peroxiredoxin